MISLLYAYYYNVGLNCWLACGSCARRLCHQTWLGKDIAHWGRQPAVKNCHDKGVVVVPSMSSERQHDSDMSTTVFRGHYSTIAADQGYVCAWLNLPHPHHTHTRMQSETDTWPLLLHWMVDKKCASWEGKQIHHSHKEDVWNTWQLILWPT